MAQTPSTVMPGSLQSIEIDAMQAVSVLVSRGDIPDLEHLIKMNSASK
jgi:hypothetical protein